MPVLNARINGAWVPVGGGNDTVFVSADDPLITEPDALLWYDTTTGSLKANVNGVWVSTSTDPVQISEVEVSAQDPMLIANPNLNAELWYNTGGITPMAGNVPPGGTIGQPLLKLSDTDAHTGWGGVIEMGATDKMHWGATIGEKIVLWDQGGANRFGLGVEAGTFALYTPASNKFSFRQDTSAGAEWAYINNTGIHTVSRHFTADGDGFGFFTNGGGGFYKKSGAGITIRESSGGQQPRIEDNNGGAGRDIIDTTNGDARYAKWSGGTFTGQVSSNSPIVITGSDNANSKHFYVDASSNNDNHEFNVLEGRRTDLKQVFKITGMSESLPSGAGVVDGRLRMYVGNGGYGTKEFAYGEAESQGAASLNCWHFYNLSYVVRSVADQKQNVAPLNVQAASALIDAINPITFDRLQPRGEEAILDTPPTHHVGFTVEDVESANITGMVHGDGEKRGWSLDGMMAIAISEIKSLRARVAQLEKPS